MSVCVYGRLKIQSFSREIAGTAVWCLLMEGVRLWEMSVSGGSTVISYSVSAVIIVNVLIMWFCFFRACCGACDLYYREVMVFVTGGATIISFLVLLTMLKTKIGEFKGKNTFMIQESVLNNRFSNLQDIYYKVFKSNTPPKFCLMNVFMAMYPPRP